jgi:hypothetical protein
VVAGLPGSVGRVSSPEHVLQAMSLPAVLDLRQLQRYRWLLPLSFIYVWLYDAFPFILLIVGIYTANRWLLDHQLNLRPLFMPVWVLPGAGH